MKCPACGIAMRLEAREAGRTVWVCRNGKCPRKGQKQTEEVKKEENDHASD